MSIKHSAPLFLMASAAWCQPTVAPSIDPPGPRKGREVAEYNVTGTVETGLRQTSVGGNESRFRSDVNFGNGVRLLGGSFTAHSKDGHGKYFDEVVLNTQGFGDPYRFANFRIQKNKWYRYDGFWRANEYLNPGLPGGLLAGHFLNTARNWQDHDFTLLPQARVKVFGGFSRNTQTGPGLQSIQLFDSRGDEFPLFANIDRRQTDYRLGGEASAAGFKLIVTRGWQQFEERTGSSLPGFNPGANPADRTTITSFRRTEPYTGSTPFWRGNLLSDRKSNYSINARFSYAGGRRAFTFDELSAGTDRLGTNRNRQVLVAGGGRRPLSSGGLTASLFPSARVTITNHTAFHQIGMDGDSTYREINNASQFGEVFRFQHLGIRTILNSSEATWRAARWLGLFGAYRFSSRRIRSTQGDRVENDTFGESFAQSNRQHSAGGGIRLQPMKPLSLVLDAEVARQDRPFTPIAPKNYHILGGRLQYKTRDWQVSALSRANYNVNSGNLFTHSARSRTQSLDGSWTPRRNLSVDAGFAHLHFDAVTGIAYFASARLVGNETSVYVSNIHTTNVGVRWSTRNRVDLTLGFTRVQDTGDGRSAAGASSRGSALPALRLAQTYPLTYQSPLGRVTVRLNDRLRWNLGYQFYHFNEEFGAAGYRAHSLYSSLLFAF